MTFDKCVADVGFGCFRISRRCVVTYVHIVVKKPVGRQESHNLHLIKLMKNFPVCVCVWSCVSGFYIGYSILVLFIVDLNTVREGALWFLCLGRVLSIRTVSVVDALESRLRVCY